MAAYRVKLAAATWTDLTTLSGIRNGVLRTDGSDVTFGVATSAPTTGTALAAGSAVAFLAPGDTAELWVRSTAGAIVEIDKIGPNVYSSAINTGVVA